MEALLVSDEEGNDTKVGTPVVAGSKVEFKVLDQFKGEKVRVFKMKSKKRMMKKIFLS
jgi:large subunit ribosomal protein L21